MKRISIGTTTTLSTNTKTTNLGTVTKTSLKKENSPKNKTPKILNSYPQKYDNYNNLFNEFSSINDYLSDEISSSKESEYSLSGEYDSLSQENSLNKTISIKKELQNNLNITKHKKISKIPYYLKNQENLKLKYINENIKRKNLPKYSSDFIGIKFKKGINFPNIKIFSKKSKQNYILSEEKKLNGKKFFLNRDNQYISFGLYLDRDVIENSKELNKELIENDNDMDCDSDEGNIITGINNCLYDIKKAFFVIEKNKNAISFIKKKNANIFINSNNYI